MEPPNNRQVGAGGFVRYSEVIYIQGYVTANAFNETIMTSNTQNDELNQYTCSHGLWEQINATNRPK